LEETGLLVGISGVAFLREWVVPKYCVVPDGQDQAGFGLEVYLYAYPPGPAAASHGMPIHEQVEQAIKDAGP
jgi:hypothetical protein